MRKLLLLVMVAHAFIAVAAPKIKQKVNNGTWRVANTWDLNRIPANADTVVIPPGNTVIIDDHQNLGSSKLIVMVYGTLEFVGVGKLTLDENSAIFVQTGGIIDGNGSPAQKLRIGAQQLSGSEIQIAPGQTAMLLTNTSNSYEPVTSSSSFAPFRTSGVLPVTFVSFNAVKKNDKVVIKWTTASEQNSKRFDIERSTNGQIWTIVSVIAAAGNSSTLINYSFTDVSANEGTVYYRIRQVDMDGKFTYTPVRSVVGDDKAEVKIWAVNGKLALNFSKEVESIVKVQVVSLGGQVVDSEKVNQPVGQVKLEKANLKGYYVVVLTNEKNNTIATQKVVF